jgi:hypothetical protein
VPNRVSFELASPAWHGDFVRLVQGEIESRGARRVCDIGGGANPALSTEFVTAHDLEYLVIDISAAELAKAPAGGASTRPESTVASWLVSHPLLSLTRYARVALEAR